MDQAKRDELLGAIGEALLLLLMQDRKLIDASTTERLRTALAAANRQA